MIESIHIHNFQCHKDLSIYLGRSTVLQGDSNHGKTAVLRALYWVMYNEPQGTDFISYWAYKKLKNGIRFIDGQYTEVVVHVDGHTIVRHRGEDFNGYVVDGVRYEALRSDVPAEVSSLLNLSDVSVQKQLDAPFLLSMTPGEAAQYLNKLANLEDVSGILATAKKASMDAAADAEQAKAEAEEAEKREKQFGWIEEVQELSNKCEAAKTETNSVRDRLEAIGATIEDYDVYARELHPLERAVKALPDPVNNAEAIRACQEGVATLRSYRDADQEDACMSVAFASLAQLGDYPADKDFGRSKLEKTLDDFDKLDDVDAMQAAEASIEALKEEIHCRVPHLHLDHPTCMDLTPRVRLEDSLKAYDSLDDLERLRDAEEQLDALGPIVTIEQTPLAAIEKSLEDYDAVEDVTQIDGEIAELEKSIEGQVCPTCGRPYALH